jgi:hypothetical protein
MRLGDLGGSLTEDGGVRRVQDEIEVQGCLHVGDLFAIQFGRPEYPLKRSVFSGISQSWVSVAARLLDVAVSVYKHAD